MPDRIDWTTVDQHVTAYAGAQPRYEAFAKYIDALVSEHCDELIHTTEHRAKNVDSFAKKAHKLKDDGSIRYPAPLSDITDMCGVRVIVFVREFVDIVCQKIGEILRVEDMEDVGDRVYSQGKFGYQSKHMLIRLGPDREKLFENRGYEGMICEIQVRTILQHAWAEMEHNIQYKSDQEIPLDLKKRFSALAGLLEIADREFQRIQQDSEALKNTVKAELINDLTQQGLEEKQNAPDNGTPAGEQSVAVRDLVNKRRYAEAIAIYSSKIAQEPQSNTLYIGRAKSRFLDGDVRGALADLDEADRLKANTEITRRLRAIIERGDDPGTALRTLRNDQFSEGLKRAADALEAGDGVRAFEEYSLLEASSYNRAFSLFGKAMCCTMERDTNGARGLLEGLELRPSTPMAINICALRWVLCILDGRDSAGDEHALATAMENMPTYSFGISPLKPFLAGIGKRGFAEAAAIKAVFARIGAA